MPRATRTDVGDLVYHVLNRANARAPLFEDETDYRRFAELIAEERAGTGMRLLAWCLMPNHWHLVLWPRAEGELGRFVRRLTQRHTQHWHGRHGTRGQGHLYQGRYKAFLVQDDAHLVTVCRYVERNPLRAGLVASAADWPHGSLAQLRRRGAARLLDPWPLPRGAKGVRTLYASHTLRYPSFMPRAPRTDVGGLVYHVLNRANARAPLFDDETDYRRFALLIAEKRAGTGMRV